MGDKGFSLIEIIIAAVIITVVAGGIFGTASYSKRMSNRAQEQMLALSIVERRLNELRNAGPESLPVTPLAPTSWNACVVAEGSPLPEGCELTTKTDDGLDGYLLTVVKLPPGETDQNKKEAMVQFGWNRDLLGRTHPGRQVSLASYLFQE